MQPPVRTGDRSGVDIQALLDAGIRELGLDIHPAAVRRLIQFVGLLAKWNRIYSLTSVRDPRDMIIRHILDSLAVTDFVRGPRVLDIGTGPGLPGLVLALARPDWDVVLLDSSRKKLRFVRQALHELAVANANVVETRAEAFRPEQRFDTVICRAFGSLRDIYALARPLCTETGLIMAMKGSYPEAELTELPDAGIAPTVHRLQVPGLDAERHLVIMQSNN